MGFDLNFGGILGVFYGKLFLGNIELLGGCWSIKILGENLENTFESWSTIF
jgi:hypothetical protein